MWNKGWRDKTWSEIDRHWDVLVIGGGITGAGILRESQRAGMQTLLVEAGDFASGTSSRSSKLVHGGFRYLRNAQVSLTKKSVRERERLIKEGRGLVNPMGILLLNYDGDAIPGWMFGLGLVVYDFLASKWGHRHYDALDMRELCPAVNTDRLTGGFRYFDAQTDDARLVLRVIQESVREGAVALNYASAEKLLKLRDGRVCGILLRDVSPEGQGRYQEINSRVAVNATGAWADDLRQQVGGLGRLRKLARQPYLDPIQQAAAHPLGELPASAGCETCFHRALGGSDSGRDYRCRSQRCYDYRPYHQCLRSRLLASGSPVRFPLPRAHPCGYPVDFFRYPPGDRHR